MHSLSHMELEENKRSGEMKTTMFEEQQMDSDTALMCV